jgi:hypothetical protein
LSPDHQGAQAVPPRPDAAGRPDISAPPRAIDVFMLRLSRAEVRRYDLDHFEPFYVDHPTQVAADQAEWLRRTVIAP